MRIMLCVVPKGVEPFESIFGRNEECLNILLVDLDLDLDFLYLSLLHEHVQITTRLYGSPIQVHFNIK